MHFISGLWVVEIHWIQHINFFYFFQTKLKFTVLQYGFNRSMTLKMLWLFWNVFPEHLLKHLTVHSRYWETLNLVCYMNYYLIYSNTSLYNSFLLLNSLQSRFCSLFLVFLRFAKTRQLYRTLQRSFTYQVHPVLTLFRKPFSTLAALTDNDLGIRIGFSKMTERERGKKKDRG